jgi:4,5-DOPA dioxygenase extradiol
MSTMPVLFIGHGTPMNLLGENPWTAAWSRIGRRIAHPRAILAISGHWCTRGTAVTAMPNPPTIHDFSGFPEPLHAFEYPAPGDPELAQRVQRLLAPVAVRMEDSWGFDHGVWVVLAKMYPAANIPVVALSIDMMQPPLAHFEIGRRLGALRDEGVLVLCSGNVVHNLRLFERDSPDAYDWAVTFNDFVRNALLDGDSDRLINYAEASPDARLAVPTPDHYYPLLYAVGAAKGDPPTIETDDVYAGAISMLSAAFGLPKDRSSSDKT